MASTWPVEPARSGIWKASKCQRLLAEHGLVISAGRCSRKSAKPEQVTEVTRSST